MSDKLFLGYDPDFLKEDTGQTVDLPAVIGKHKNDLPTVEETGETVLHYMNYSVQLSASRKFAIYAASNIDGGLFKKATRAPNWKKDDRLKEFQFGQELYGAPSSDFDKGHMVKREDVQWADTPGLAQKAADSTFFYSNAAPQHKDLNQEIWKSLEDYILHTEAKEQSLRVCVFTGPVLSKNDPPFVSEVKGETVLLPIVFWKVVIYAKSDGQLYRVGFMMSQRRLLTEHGIIVEVERDTAEDRLFLEFDDAETYQVNVSLIEELTGLRFYAAKDAYTDTRGKQLVLKEIDIDPDLESDSVEQQLGYSISNLTL
jgi:endonuclease G